MSPREVIEEWVKRFNSADAAAVAELYHDDTVNHQVTQDPVEGRAAIHELFERGLATAEMTCIPVVIHEAGDLVILEWRDPLAQRAHLVTAHAAHAGVDITCPPAPEGQLAHAQVALNRVGAVVDQSHNLRAPLNGAAAPRHRIRLRFKNATVDLR